MPKKTTKAAKDAEARTAYRLTRKDADRILKRSKVNPEDRAALRDAAAGAEDHGGTALARVARHALKWLPNADSETTVPLTAAEAKALGLS